MEGADAKRRHESKEIEEKGKRKQKRDKGPGLKEDRRSRRRRRRRTIGGGRAAVPQDMNAPNVPPKIS